MVEWRHKGARGRERQKDEGELPVGPTWLREPGTSPPQHSDPRVAGLSECPPATMRDFLNDDDSVEFVAQEADELKLEIPGNKPALRAAPRQTRGMTVCLTTSEHSRCCWWTLRLLERGPRKRFGPEWVRVLLVFSPGTSISVLCELRKPCIWTSGHCNV